MPTILLAGAYPSRAANPRGEVVILGTKTVFWSGVGTISILATAADDKIILEGPGGTWSHRYDINCSYITVQGPFDITSIFVPGQNDITVKIADVCGGGIGSQEIYISGNFGNPGAAGGYVYHFVDLLAGTKNYPLYNVRAEITASYVNEFGLLEGSFTYQPVYTNSSGFYSKYIADNPFDFWTDPLDWTTFEIRKLIDGAGWNHVRVDFSTITGARSWVETLWTPRMGGWMMASWNIL